MQNQRTPPYKTIAVIFMAVAWSAIAFATWKVLQHVPWPIPIDGDPASTAANGYVASLAVMAFVLIAALVACFAVSSGAMAAILMHHGATRPQRTAALYADKPAGADDHQRRQE